MESRAERIKKLDDLAAEARERAAAYDRVAADLAQAGAALKALRAAAVEPKARHERALAARDEAAAHLALARLQVDNSRNDVAQAEAVLENRASHGAGRSRRGNAGPTATIAAPGGDSGASDAAADPLAQARYQLEEAKRILEAAEQMEQKAEAAVRKRDEAAEQAAEELATLGKRVEEAEEAAAELDQEKTAAGAAAWEAVRAVATAQRELGMILGPRPLKQPLRQPPDYLRITSPVTRLEQPVERALRVLQETDTRFKPAENLGPLLDLIGKYALAGAMKKVVERLNRLKLTASRRRILALSGYHSLYTVLAGIEEEYDGLADGEKRRAIRERVDDVEGLANDILLHQETLQRALAGRVVQDVQRFRRLSIPDDPAIRGHVVDRVTARL